MLFRSTSDVMIVVTLDKTMGRVSREGRKEEEEVCTMFNDTKEEERDEEETGWEEEAKTQPCNKGCDNNGYKPRDIECNPNGREHKPPDLEVMEMENQAHRPQQPGYDDDGNACRLAHTTCSTIEPQGPQTTPHSAPTPTTNNMICSMSISHPPTKKHHTH